VVKAVEKIKWTGMKMWKDKEWREVDGVIYKEEKVYVPKDEQLKMKIIWLYYDMPVGEHRGQ